MRCPFCKLPDTRVIDSRAGRDQQIIRRRRECEGCARRFTTYEQIEDVWPAVVKRDGRRESFNREKILVGVHKACEKRPVSRGRVDQLADDIERHFAGTSDREIASTQIGEVVLHQLREIDEVAYVRFASVYRDFRDVSEFMNELAHLLHQRHNPGSPPPGEAESI